MLGLGLGICAAFFQERLDDTLKGADDVERVLGLEAVGLIPAVSQLNGNQPRHAQVAGNNEALSRKENGNGRRPPRRGIELMGKDPQHTPLIEAFRQSANVDLAFDCRSSS